MNQTNQNMESDINFLRDITKRVECMAAFDSSLVSQLTTVTNSLLKFRVEERHISLLENICKNVHRLLRLAKTQGVPGQTGHLVDLLRKCLLKRQEISAYDAKIFTIVLDCCDHELNVRTFVLRETIREILGFASKKHHHSSTELALSSLNQMLAGTSRPVRHELSELARTELLELVQYLLHCGDYYLQEAAMETFTRLATSDTRKKCCEEWFGDFPKVAKEAFMEFGKEVFQKEVRVFLNAVNSVNDTGVLTVTCYKAVIGSREFFNPAVEYTQEWYLDICSFTRSIGFYAIRSKDDEIDEKNPMLLMKITYRNVKLCSLLDSNKPGYFQFTAILHEPLEGHFEIATGDDLILSVIVKLADKNSIISIMGDKFEEDEVYFDKLIFKTSQNSAPLEKVEESELQLKSPNRCDPSFFMFKYPNEETSDKDSVEAGVDWGAAPSSPPEPVGKAPIKRQATPAVGKSALPHSPGMSTFADYVTVADPDEDLDDEEPEGLEDCQATPRMPKGILKGSSGPNTAAAKRKGTPAVLPKAELKTRKSTPAVGAQRYPDDDDESDTEMKSKRHSTPMPKPRVTQQTTEKPDAVSKEQTQLIVKQQDAEKALDQTFSAPSAPKRRGRQKISDTAKPRKPLPRKTASKPAAKEPQPKPATRRGRKPKCPIETTQEETPIGKRKLSAAMDESSGAEIDEQVFKEDASKLTKLPHEIFVEELRKRKSVYSGPKKPINSGSNSKKGSEFDKLVESTGRSYNQSKIQTETNMICDGPKKGTRVKKSPKLFDEYNFSDASVDEPKPKSIKKSVPRSNAKKAKKSPTIDEDDDWKPTRNSRANKKELTTASVKKIGNQPVKKQMDLTLCKMSKRDHRNACKSIAADNFAQHKVDDYDFEDSLNDLAAKKATHDLAHGAALPEKTALSLVPAKHELFKMTYAMIKDSSDSKSWRAAAGAPKSITSEVMNQCEVLDDDFEDALYDCTMRVPPKLAADTKKSNKTAVSHASHKAESPKVTIAMLRDSSNPKSWRATADFKTIVSPNEKLVCAVNEEEFGEPSVFRSKPGNKLRLRKKQQDAAESTAPGLMRTIEVNENNWAVSISPKLSQPLKASDLHKTSKGLPAVRRLKPELEKKPTSGSKAPLPRKEKYAQNTTTNKQLQASRGGNRATRVKIDSHSSKVEPKPPLRQAKASEKLNEVDSSSTISDCLLVGVYSPSKIQAVDGPAYNFEDLFEQSDEDAQKTAVDRHRSPQVAKKTAPSKRQVDSDEESPKEKPQPKRLKQETRRAAKTVTSKTSMRNLQVESDDSSDPESLALKPQQKKSRKESPKIHKARNPSKTTSPKMDEDSEDSLPLRQRMASKRSKKSPTAGRSKELEDSNTKSQPVSRPKVIALPTKSFHLKKVEELAKKLRALHDQFKLKENKAKYGLRIRITCDMKIKLQEAIESYEAFFKQLEDQKSLVRDMIEALKDNFLVPWEERVDAYSKKAKALQDVSKLSFNKNDVISDSKAALADYQHEIYVHVSVIVQRFISFMELL